MANKTLFKSLIGKLVPATNAINEERAAAYALDRRYRIGDAVKMVFEVMAKCSCEATATWLRTLTDLVAKTVSHAKAQSTQRGS